MIQSTTQKQLGMFLDTKLDFKEHLKDIFNKAKKVIGVLLKLHHVLPRSPLFTVHIDYGDIIYDQTYTASFYQ